LAQSAQTYAAAATRAQQAGLEKSSVARVNLRNVSLGFIGPEQGVAALEEAVRSA